MKTVRLAGLAVLLFAAACNNASEGDDDVDTTAGNITNVENVNGNLPDTSNSITLDDSDTINTPGEPAPR